MEKEEEVHSDKEKSFFHSRLFRVSLIILGIIVLVFILGAGYFYFFVISSTFVSKPELVKPVLASVNSSELGNGTVGENSYVIRAEHLIFLLNEIGAYKLHNSPNGDVPLLKVKISDFNKEYLFSVSDGKINEKKSANAPDLAISLKQEELIKVYNSDNSNARLKEGVISGAIDIEILADETALAFKGYKAVYDSLS